jgi:hypothetical protein
MSFEVTCCQRFKESLLGLMGIGICTLYYNMDKDVSTIDIVSLIIVGMFSSYYMTGCFWYECSFVVISDHKISMRNLFSKEVLSAEWGEVAKFQKVDSKDYYEVILTNEVGFCFEPVGKGGKMFLEILQEKVKS